MADRLDFSTLSRRKLSVISRGSIVGMKALRSRSRRPGARSGPGAREPCLGPVLRIHVLSLAKVMRVDSHAGVTGRTSRAGRTRPRACPGPDPATRGTGKQETPGAVQGKIWRAGLAGRRRRRRRLTRLGAAVNLVRAPATETSPRIGPRLRRLAAGFRAAGGRPQPRVGAGRVVGRLVLPGPDRRRRQPRSALLEPALARWDHLRPRAVRGVHAVAPAGLRGVLGLVVPRRRGGVGPGGGAGGPCRAVRMPSERTGASFDVLRP